MSWCFRLVLAVCCLTPVSADVIDLNVNGTVNGAGQFFIVCTSGSPGCPDDVAEAEVPINVDGTNTQLGAFTKSAQASFDDVSGRSTSVSVQFQQTTEANPSGFSADVQTTAILNGVGAEWGGRADFFNNYSLEFTLTTESLVHLTTVLTGPSFDYLNLEGPGIEIGGPPFTSLDQSFAAGPGQYTLVMAVYDLGFCICVSGGITTHFSEFSDLSLNAEFIPIVPEPRWGAIVVPVFLTILGCFVSRQRSLPQSTQRIPTNRPLSRAV